VAVHVRHFPLPSHQRAEPAARAMQAALRQGKGWEMEKLIFENMRQLSDEDILGFAKQLELDIDKFKTDYESEAIKKEVAEDLAAGRAAGVRGTPTIFVNGKRFSGPRSLEGFKPVVEEEIKKADALIQAGTPIDKVYEKLASGG
jgi:predicted DsbA family dithiol-disulfide isomerase